MTTETLQLLAAGLPRLRKLSVRYVSVWPPVCVGGARLGLTLRRCASGCVMVTEDGLAHMVTEIGDRPFALNVTSWSVGPGAAGALPGRSC